MSDTRFSTQVNIKHNLKSFNNQVKATIEQLPILDSLLKNIKQSDGILGDAVSQNDRVLIEALTAQVNSLSTEINKLKKGGSTGKSPTVFKEINQSIQSINANAVKQGRIIDTLTQRYGSGSKELQRYKDRTSSLKKAQELLINIQKKSDKELKKGTLTQQQYTVAVTKAQSAVLNLQNKLSGATPFRRLNTDIQKSTNLLTGMQGRLDGISSMIGRFFPQFNTIVGLLQDFGGLGPNAQGSLSIPGLRESREEIANSVVEMNNYRASTRNAGKANSFFALSSRAVMGAVAGLTVSLLGLAVTYTKIGKNAFQASKNMEANIYKMGALINATTQFYDKEGKELGIVENFRVSLDRAKQLIKEFQQDAPKLVNVEIGDLILTSQVALSRMTKLGITDLKEQAKLIEDITVSLKQLGIAQTELEFRNKVEAFLEGDTSANKGQFTKIVAESYADEKGAGIDRFEKAREEAIKTGKAYEFMTKALVNYYASSELSENTLQNQISVLKSVQEQANVLIGDAFGEDSKAIVREFYEAISGGGAVLEEKQKAQYEAIGNAIADLLGMIVPLVEPVVQGVINLLSGVSVVISGVINSINWLLEQMGLLDVKYEKTQSAGKKSIRVTKELSLAFKGLAIIIGNLVLYAINPLLGAFATIATVFGATGLAVKKFGVGIQNIDKDINKLQKKLKKDRFVIEIDGKLQFDEKEYQEAVKKNPKNKRFFNDVKKKTIKKLNKLQYLEQEKTTPTSYDPLKTSGRGGVSTGDIELSKEKARKAKQEAERKKREAERLANAQKQLEETLETNKLKSDQLDIEEKILDINKKKSDIQNSTNKALLNTRKEQNSLSVEEKKLNTKREEIEILYQSGQIGKSQYDLSLNTLNKDLEIVKAKQDANEENRIALELENKKLLLEEQKLINSEKEKSKQLEINKIKNDIVQKKQEISQETDPVKQTNLKKELSNLETSLDKAEFALTKLKDNHKNIIVNLEKQLASLGTKLNSLKETNIQEQKQRSIQSQADALRRVNTEFNDDFKTAGKEVVYSLLDNSQSIGERIARAFADLSSRLLDKFLDGAFNKLFQGKDLGSVSNFFSGIGSNSSNSNYSSNSGNYTADLNNWKRLPESGGLLKKVGGLFSKIPGIGSLLSGAGGALSFLAPVTAGLGVIGGLVKGIFSRNKKKKQERAKREAELYKRRVDKELKKIEEADEAVADEVYEYQQAQSEYLASVPIGLKKQQDELKDVLIKQEEALKVRENALAKIKRISISGDAKALLQGQDIKNIQQLEKDIKNYIKDINKTNEDIEQLFVEAGQQYYDFAQEVRTSSIEKEFRGIGESIFNAIEKANSSIEAGFDEEQVYKLLDNELKDITNDAFADIGNTIENIKQSEKELAKQAVENLNSQLESLSNNIRSITEQFGFTKELTGSQQIELAIKQFRKEKQKSDEEIAEEQNNIQKEIDDLINKKKTIQDVINESKEAGINAVTQKQLAGGTENFLKILGQAELIKIDDKKIETSAKKVANRANETINNAIEDMGDRIVSFMGGN